MNRPPACLALAVLAFSSPAWAEPWFGWGQGRAEDRYESGDLDPDDVLRPAASAAPSRARVGADVHAGTWISLEGLVRAYEDGYRDVGLLVIAGVSFDKVAQGRAHDPGETSARPSSLLAWAGSADPPPANPTLAPVAAPPPARAVVTPLVARRAVAAAWKAAGLGVDDAKLDAMVSRARASAALPEARLRAMRVFLLDGTESTVVPIDTSTYETAGATLVLEARLTWRLDRLLYADDEPSLERLRLERQEARGKIAGRVLDALFQWERARAAVREAKPGSRESTDATMRLIEAAAGLDVLTGGWFGAFASSLPEEAL